MSIYIDKRAQKLWNSLCEFYNKEQRRCIRSGIEMLIEKTALEQGISLDDGDVEHKTLNKKIATRYIIAVYHIALRYLHEVPDAKEIPVIEFTYEELFRDELEPTDPEDQPG